MRPELLEWPQQRWSQATSSQPMKRTLPKRQLHLLQWQTLRVAAWVALRRACWARIEQRKPQSEPAPARLTWGWAKPTKLPSSSARTHSKASLLLPGSLSLPLAMPPGLHLASRIASAAPTALLLKLTHCWASWTSTCHWEGRRGSRCSMSTTPSSLKTAGMWPASRRSSKTSTRRKSQQVTPAFHLARFVQKGSIKRS